ncbi:MAG TPA: DUF4349 domain-containing protein [Lysobacter sp.]
MTKHAMAALALVALLVGCSRKVGEPMGAAAAQAVLDRKGAMLAYEHTARVRLDADAIPARLKAVQDACTQRRFGECTVLEVSQQGGEYPSASLTVRSAPAAVEPLIALAGNDGEIGSRTTRAEDLAVEVGDNEQLRQRLHNERAQLLEFQKRRDLAVADMIALSRQLAEVDSQLHAADRDAAQQRMRIETQKLTIGFAPPELETGGNEIARALREAGGVLASGTAWTIRAVAFLLPLMVVLGIVVLAWRVRRARRAR